MIRITKVDEVYIRVHCEKGVAQEIADLFTFHVEGYKYTPAFKSGFWDGKIRLFDSRKMLYFGLLPDLEQYLKTAEYEYVVDFESPSNELSLLELEEFISSLNLPFAKQRDYHTKSILQCVRNSRRLIQSPTGSGKSAIIYILIRYLQEHLIKKKTLLIVPTKHLVNQMIGDFKEYGYDVESSITGIVGGVDKNELLDVVVSTWQSIYKMPQEWFDQFDVVIGDEVHLFKANSLRGLMEKCTRAKFKFGFTGSLSDTKVHLLVLKGLFGDVYVAAKTHELMGTDLADFKIKALILKHDRKKILEYIKENKLKKLDYQSEIFYIQQNSKRNRFISNLALSLKGNTLILFQNIEAQGDLIFENITNKNKTKELFFISSKTEVEERERIRKYVNESDNCVVVATYGTYSAGVNVPNLHNVIFAHPSKSKIRNLQSIGRGLRKGSNKECCVLYDLADDFRSSSGSAPNTTLTHFLERLELYNREKFKIKTYNIQL